jgi:hypothetical protein
VVAARSCSGLSRDCGESRHFGTGPSETALAPTRGACLIYRALLQDVHEELGEVGPSQERRRG